MKNEGKMKLVRFLAMVAVFGFLAPLPTQAESTAQGVIRAFYAQLVSSMKQGDQLGFNGRYKKLAPVIQASFNLPLMARTAVGSSWTEASETQRKDIVAAFSNFSISTYANRFASYDGEEFVVTGEKVSSKDVVVETTLKPKGGNAVTLNYLMRRDDKGAYRIVDVYMNGTISELATRRSEFSSIARREGIPALVNSLQKKAKQLGAS
jgi:phospholipid transport system substrate-binding protein